MIAMRAFAFAGCLGALLLLGAPVAAVSSAGDGCGSLSRTVGAQSVDLAPPPGFVEICSQDAALCQRLTANYPRSVTTLGYFVPSAEWAAHAQAPTAPFSRYLIAQVVPGKTAKQLPEVKSFIRSQQQDPTALDKLAETLRGSGQAQLGIFDESADSISFGAVAMQPTPGPGGAGILAMTNSAIAVEGEMLSLYVYSRLTDPAGVAGVEALAKRWLQCIRSANHP